MENGCNSAGGGVECSFFFFFKWFSEYERPVSTECSSSCFPILPSCTRVAIRPFRGSPVVVNKESSVLCSERTRDYICECPSHRAKQTRRNFCKSFFFFFVAAMLLFHMHARTSYPSVITSPSTWLRACASTFC